MKFENLIKRYTKLGYEFQDFKEKELELDSIILWLRKKYLIHIYVNYMEHNYMVSYKKVGGLKVNYFNTHWILYYGTKNNVVQYGEKYFDNPYDSKFECLKKLSKFVSEHDGMIKKGYKDIYGNLLNKNSQ